jgi:hypothetical protein
VQEEIKTKWVAALRSGAYKQAKYEFFNGECHCAIGVLLDISGEGKWEENKKAGSYNFISEKAFVTIFSDMKLAPTTRSNIMRMNDSEELSFVEIADHVEGWSK